ncbi:MAG: DNA polymerase III subunit epsilon [Rhodospirillales bacterium]|nr:DNA polymerase III subunit epsilon [Rhodospirillales bacterium]
MREIALDTETTGLNPRAGHRVVEIGCVEMINHVATGQVFHAYINPERDMPEEAFSVHGLSEAFLRDHPKFAEVVEKFLAFIGNDTLVIHNAQFDMGFLNAELERAGQPPLDMSRAIDTVKMARQKFPGAQASLDALCRRFAIDNSNRELHGALLDARLLADVYLELKGGRQTGLGLAGFGLDADIEQPAGLGGVRGVSGANANIRVETRQKRETRLFQPSAEELARHEAFIQTLGNALWKA